MIMWLNRKINKTNISKFIMFLYVVGAASSVFIVALIRADYASLTYDEGFSYINYIFPLNITSIESMKDIVTDCLANNHLLNTFLCSIFMRITHIAWNDFFMRLPSLIFYGIFLVVLIWAVYKEKIGIITYSLFIFNYYLNEFSSLARGYGMATCLVLLAIIMYENWRKSNGQKLYYLSLFLLFLVLATTANTIVLLVMVAFSPYVLFLLIKEKNLLRFLTRYCWAWIPLGCVSVWLVKFHFTVSEIGKPLYAKPGTIYEVVIKSFIGMIVKNEILLHILTFSLVLLIIIGVIIAILNNILIKDAHVNYIYPFILFIGELVVFRYIFNYGLPTERVLLPMYPMLLFFLMDIGKNISVLWNDIVKENIMIRHIVRRVVTFCIIGFLVLSFVERLSFTTYQDWKENSEYKKLAYDAMVNPKTNRDDLVEMDYPMQYYWVKMVKDYKYDIYAGTYSE